MWTKSYVSLPLSLSCLSVQSRNPRVNGSNKVSNSSDTAVCSLEAEAQRAELEEERDLSPGSHQSGLPTLFFKRGQVACYTHTHSVYVSVHVRSHIMMPFLWFHSSWISETLLSSFRVFNGKHFLLFHTPPSIPLKRLCGLSDAVVDRLPAGDSALHSTILLSDMNSTHAYCDEPTDSST